jgi:hypothetical protein
MGEMMVILVSGATKTHAIYWSHPSFGFLINPRNGNRPELIASADKPWGVDNDAFNGWTIEVERNFSRLLGRLCLISDRSQLKFIAAPDVVGDCIETTNRFKRWQPIIAASGFPVAYVGQDGIQPDEVPWDDCECLFVGGTTDWKLSEDVDRLIHEAKERGKWVHVGRVNTKCRLRHFYEVGADSIDGTFFSRWPDIAFAKGLKWLSRLESQRQLECV